MWLLSSLDLLALEPSLCTEIPGVLVTSTGFPQSSQELPLKLIQM